MEGMCKIKGSLKTGENLHLLRVHHCVKAKIRTPAGKLQFELRKLLGRNLEKALNMLKQLHVHGKPTPNRVERKDKQKQHRVLLPQGKRHWRGRRFELHHLAC